MKERKYKKKKAKPEKVKKKWHRDFVSQRNKIVILLFFMV